MRVRVYGLPVPQARPRAVIRGKHAGVYDPKTNLDWKRTVAAQILPHRPPAPHSGALSVELHFFMPRPKSLPKRVFWHTKKPDVDNLAKAVKDAMKGIVYVDDSQVVRLTVTKGYSDKPGVEVTVKPVDPDDRGVHPGRAGSGHETPA